MIKSTECLDCGSSNCEVSVNIIRKKNKYLYPDNAKKTHCYLCYDCGFSVTILEFKKGVGK